MSKNEPDTVTTMDGPPLEEAGARTPDHGNSKRQYSISELLGIVSSYVIAIGVGFGAYQTIIKTARMDIVCSDCYILKKDLIGGLSLKQVIDELEDLIAIGQRQDADAVEIQSWLLQSLTFVHRLDIEKDAVWEGTPISMEEKLILNAFEGELELQKQRTLGILAGIKAGYSTMKP